MAQHKQLTWTELRVDSSCWLLRLSCGRNFLRDGAGALVRSTGCSISAQVDGLTVGAPVRLDGVDVETWKKSRSRCQSGRSAVKGRSIGSICASQKDFQDYIRSTPRPGS